MTDWQNIVWNAAYSNGGFLIPDYTAKAISAAVLAHHDKELTVQHTIGRSQIAHFEDEYVPSINDHLRRRLYQMIGEEEVIPIELARENRVYLKSHLFTDVEAREVGPDGDWDQVQIQWRVKVRNPE